MQERRYDASRTRSVKHKDYRPFNVLVRVQQPHSAAGAEDQLGVVVNGAVRLLGVRQQAEAVVLPDAPSINRTRISMCTSSAI